MLSEIILNAKILIIDDEITNIRLLEKILLREGYVNISLTTDSRDAVSMFADDEPDLILLDLHMPHQTGFEVMASLASLQDSTVLVPIIVLTADVTPEAKHRALSSGATDFVSKPFDTTEVALRIKNALRVRVEQRQLDNKNKILDERVRQD
jgi:PleD family two-component response regulator